MSGTIRVTTRMTVEGLGCYVASVRVKSCSSGSYGKATKVNNNTPEQFLEVVVA